VSNLSLAQKLSDEDARDLLATLIELIEKPDMDDPVWILRELRREIAETENLL